MFVRGVIVLLCVLVAVSDGAGEPNCKYSSDVCPMNYSPVCGSDGKTYGNECELCAANKASKTKILIQKQGECEKPIQPDMCPMVYSPVCGSDGVTYGNECMLRVANQTSKTEIFIQKQGKCDKPLQPNCKYPSDACPMNYSPMCGSDGKTYGNECELCAANKASKTKILIQKQGECEPLQPNCKYSSDVCPRIYSPVCGSDGKTYSNECELCAANKASKTKILIQKKGECEPLLPEMCPLHYSPVCGSDGVTYSNECMLRVANKASKTKILIQKQGECDKPIQPNCKYSSDVCPMNYSPVCGSDGKTYSNECELCAANKVSKTKILIQKQGECEPLQPNCKYSSDVCPLNYSPVCGSDGKTYSNECMLCAANKVSKTKILIQKQGKCDEHPQPNCKYSSNVCPMHYSPVCGSDGVTYSNECMLCAANKASNKKVFIQKQGPC